MPAGRCPWSYRPVAGTISLMESAQPAPIAVADDLETWLAAATEDSGPFELLPLTGGNSNETLLVSSPTDRWIMRRPPLATLDPSAHSMAREYRLLSSLCDSPVPVPRPIAVASAPAPEGRAALLMEYIEGEALTTGLPAAYRPDTADAVANAVIDGLADLHSLSWSDLGLGDLGRGERFLERQVSRWTNQLERHRHRPLPDFEIVGEWLERFRPPAGKPGILHGDFHVDNCLISPEEPARLLAIIDWEMATIGDPLLDVGLMLAFWGSDRHEPMAMTDVQEFSRAAGAPSRAELAERYSLRSGRSLEHLDYYMTLAFWKLAAIVEGAHQHYAEGRLQTDYARALEHDVPRLLAEARCFAGI
jgi:aminoglycoside phosphotransferase (APT) family kinase protein